MKVNLSPEIIMNVLRDPGLYRQGKMVVATKGIISLTRDGDAVQGIVRSARVLFYVTIKFNKENNISETQCTCNEGRYKIPCRHVAGVLITMEFDLPEGFDHHYSDPLDFLSEIHEEIHKEIQEVNHEESNKEILEERIKKQIEKQHEKTYSFANAFDTLISPNQQKSPLDLGVFIHVEKIVFGRTIFYEWTLSLKLGMDKLYVVKSIPELLTSYRNGHSLYFGQKFSYKPQEQFFNTYHKKLLDFMDSLSPMYRKKKVSYSYYDTYESLISGKQISLDSEVLIKQLVNLLENIPFELNFHGSQGIIHGVIDHIYQEAPKLKTDIIEIGEDGSLSVEFDNVSHYIPLTLDSEYVLFDEKLYHLNETEQNLIATMNQLVQKFGNKLHVPSKQKEHFFTQVYPQLKKTNEIHMPKKYEDQVIIKPLNTKVFFERTKKGGNLARVQFIYGEEEVTEVVEEASSKDLYILRDLPQEAKINDFFTSFTKTKDGYYLEDEKEMYAFVNDRLEELKSLAEVYYEKGMLSLKSKFPKIKSSISMSADAYFEVNFEGLEYSSQELEQIYTALKEKKTFVRLKNGSFLDVDSPEIMDYFDMVEELHLPIKNLEKNKFQVPLNRSFAFDRLTKEKKIEVHQEAEYTKFLTQFEHLEAIDVPLSQDLDSIMRDYQKTGFRWLSQLSQFQLGGILADDMGLGKTLQTIALLDLLTKTDKRPYLIVAPTSLVYNWEAEIGRFAPHLKVRVINGTKEERLIQLAYLEEAIILITSYNLVLRDIDHYKTLDFARCIIDEAQNIKNPEAKTTKAVKQVSAGGYLALTGTPIENNLTELWSIFDFLMPGYLLSHQKFQKIYEKPISAGDQEALRSLKRHITPFVLRRMKKDVLKELPPKIETKSVAHMTKEQQKVYLAYLEKAKESMEQDLSEEGFGQSKIKIFSYLTRLRQICCHPETFIENYQGGSGKLELLQEILSDATEAGHKVLLFSQFTSMLSIIRKTLEEMHITYDYLDGATKALDRQGKVKAFNEGDTQVFLISLKAGGTGLNLTGADIVIHFDPWWNPAVEDQATDRAYRIGQTNSVQVFKLIAQGTIEDKIFELQQRKKEMIASVIEPGETLLNKMTEEELRSLFE